jgi:hypothetical protein
VPGTLENAKLVVGEDGLELPTGKRSPLGCSLQFINELHHLSPIMVGQPGVNDTLDLGGLNPSGDIRLNVQGSHG